MPLGPDVRYRRKGKMRLAFKGGKVIEAKNMETGATHTPEEFAHEREDSNESYATDGKEPDQDSGTRNSEEYGQLMARLKSKKR